MLNDTLRARLQNLVDAHPVVVFMKGSRHLPQCGFSAQVVQVLDEYLPTYETVNVLADPEIRQGIKDFSDWPTIPQVYVRGEFVGGCDIVREMHESGELASVLECEPRESPSPQIVLSPAAVAAFEEAGRDAEYDHLRLDISPQFQHALSFGPKLAGDIEATSNGYSLWMNKSTARRADGLRIDFVQGPTGAGFQIDNPNEPPKVKSMSVEALQAKLAASEPLWLFDVRTAEEQAIASIPRAISFDAEGQQQLQALPNDAMVVLYCHHGMRSQMAAQQVLGLGFTNVWNLAGGIDAYSRVEPSIPRY